MNKAYAYLFLSTSILGCGGTTSGPSVETSSPPYLQPSPEPRNEYSGVELRTSSVGDGSQSIHRAEIKLPEGSENILVYGERVHSRNSFLNGFGINTYTREQGGSGGGPPPVGIWGTRPDRSLLTSEPRIQFSGLAEGYVRASGEPNGNFKGDLTGEANFSAQTASFKIDTQHSHDSGAVSFTEVSFQSNISNDLYLSGDSINISSGENQERILDADVSGSFFSNDTSGRLAVGGFFVSKNGAEQITAAFGAHQNN